MVIKVTHPGHFILAAFLIWVVGGLPGVTWLTILQYLPGVTWLQVYMPYILLYSLIVTIQLVRAWITKGEKIK